MKSLASVYITQLAMSSVGSRYNHGICHCGRTNIYNVDETDIIVSPKKHTWIVAKRKKNIKLEKTSQREEWHFFSDSGHLVDTGDVYPNCLLYTSRCV